MQGEEEKKNRLRTAADSFLTRTSLPAGGCILLWTATWSRRGRRGRTMKDPPYPPTNTSCPSSLQKKRGIISALEAKRANKGEREKEKREEERALLGRAWRVFSILTRVIAHSRRDPIPERDRDEASIPTYPCSRGSASARGKVNLCTYISISLFDCASRHIVYSSPHVFYRDRSIYVYNISSYKTYCQRDIRYTSGFGVIKI